MAYTNIELRETNFDRKNISSAPPIFDGQQWEKPPLHKRLLQTFTPRFRRQPSLKVEVQHDHLEQLLQGSDDPLTTDLDARLRKHYVLFKDSAGVEVIDSLILIKCFIPPSAGEYDNYLGT